MAGSSNDSIYTRDERIVFGFDIGTTQSAVSYAYCYPGEAPDVRLVTKWPGQPEAAGDSKIPSLVAYQRGVLKACAAEATDYVDDDEYQVAKWFKLHLHPESMKVSDDPPSYDDPNGRSPEIEIPPLPEGVALRQIYADLLKYMFDHAQRFFIENTPAGSRIWERLCNDVAIVLATPNGWDTDQQLFLREVAIQSGIVDESSASMRVDFVTEGEASVHYALAHTRGRSWLQPGVMFVVTDAGGSTVDSTLYECKALEPGLVLEEVCASECVQAGGVFVDRAAEIMLEAKLRNSKFADEEFVKLMVDEFERKTKRIFDDTQPSNVIHFGRSADNDREHGIIKGKLSLNKQEVGSTYDDVVTRIVNSCLRLLRGQKVQFLLLVGGFGESPYLRKRLRETYESQGMDVVTVDEPSKKAAAEGAVIWYIKQLVVARAARFTVGLCTENFYKPEIESHKLREKLSYVSPMNDRLIDAFFTPILEKDTVVNENLLQERSFWAVHRSRPDDLGKFTVPLYAWEGQGTSEWVKDENGALMPQMRLLCTLVADLSRMGGLLRKQKATNGTAYWAVNFTVAIMFGGTQLHAKLKWVEGVSVFEPIEIAADAFPEYVEEDL